VRRQSSFFQAIISNTIEDPMEDELLRGMISDEDNHNDTTSAGLTS